MVQPNHQMAELKISETQARDVRFGEPATIDTHNGIVSGAVMRIDPAVENGTVTVDVKLISELPQGARPDLSMDGTIDLVKVGRESVNSIQGIKGVRAGDRVSFPTCRVGTRRTASGLSKQVILRNFRGKHL